MGALVNVAWMWTNLSNPHTHTLSEPTQKKSEKGNREREVYVPPPVPTILLLYHVRRAQHDRAAIQAASLRRSLETGWGAAVKPAELFEAITIGGVDRITFVLAQGVSMDEKVLNSTTVLSYAAGQGRVKVVALLIKYGASLEVKDDDELTALLFTVRTDHIRIVTEFPRSGADVDATNNEGATAMGNKVRASRGDGRVGSPWCFRQTQRIWQRQRSEGTHDERIASRR